VRGGIWVCDWCIDPLDPLYKWAPLERILSFGGKFNALGISEQRHCTKKDEKQIGRKHFASSRHS